VESAFEGALGGVDAALEAFEVTGGVAEGVAKGGIFVGVEEAGDGVCPNLGVDFGEAAELPDVADEGVDEMALLGVAGWKRSRYSAVRVLREEAALPWAERGPVDFWALRRLASI
jgi:hypothetical protein